jgi:hypothetical protein
MGCACLFGQLVADKKYRIAHDVQHLANHNAPIGKGARREVEKADVTSITVSCHRAAPIIMPTPPGHAAISD